MTLGDSGQSRLARSLPLRLPVSLLSPLPLLRVRPQPAGPTGQTRKMSHPPSLLWFARNVKIVIPITKGRDEGHLPHTRLLGR